MQTVGKIKDNSLYLNREISEEQPVNYDKLILYLSLKGELITTKNYLEDVNLQNFNSHSGSGTYWTNIIQDGTFLGNPIYRVEKGSDDNGYFYAYNISGLEKIKDAGEYTLTGIFKSSNSNEWVEPLYSVYQGAGSPWTVGNYIGGYDTKIYKQYLGNGWWRYIYTFKVDRNRITNIVYRDKLYYGFQWIWQNTGQYVWGTQPQLYIGNVKKIYQGYNYNANNLIKYKDKISIEKQVMNQIIDSNMNNYPIGYDRGVCGFGSNFNNQFGYGNWSTKIIPQDNCILPDIKKAQRIITNQDGYGGWTHIAYGLDYFEWDYNNQSTELLTGYMPPEVNYFEWGYNSPETQLSIGTSTLKLGYFEWNYNNPSTQILTGNSDIGDGENIDYYIQEYSSPYILQYNEQELYGDNITYGVLIRLHYGEIQFGNLGRQDNLVINEDYYLQHNKKLGEWIWQVGAYYPSDGSRFLYQNGITKADIQQVQVYNTDQQLSYVDGAKDNQHIEIPVDTFNLFKDDMTVSFIYEPLSNYDLSQLFTLNQETSDNSMDQFGIYRDQNDIRFAITDGTKQYNYNTSITNQPLNHKLYIQMSYSSLGQQVGYFEWNYNNSSTEVIVSEDLPQVQYFEWDYNNSSPQLVVESDVIPSRYITGEGYYSIYARDLDTGDVLKSETINLPADFAFNNGFSYQNLGSLNNNQQNQKFSEFHFYHKSFQQNELENLIPRQFQIDRYGDQKAKNIYEPDNMLYRYGQTQFETGQFGGIWDRYTQTNCYVSIVPRRFKNNKYSYFIKRMPNSTDQNWGGLQLTFPNDKTWEEGETYRLSFQYSGYSNKNIGIYFAYSIGNTSNGVGLTSMQLPYITNSFVDEDGWQYYEQEFTIPSGYIYQTGTDNNIYYCMRQMKIGYGYDTLDNYGNRLYINDLKIEKITNKQNIGIKKDGIYFKDFNENNKLKNIYIVGTAYDQDYPENRVSGNRILRIDDALIYNQTGRGLRLTVFDSNFNVISDNTYDVYGSDQQRTDLQSQLLSINRENYFQLTSYDQISSNANLVNQMNTLGSTIFSSLTYRSTYQAFGKERKILYEDGQPQSANYKSKQVINFKA